MKHELKKIIYIAGMFMEKHLVDMHGMNKEDVIKNVAHLSKFIEDHYILNEKRIDSFMDNMENNSNNLAKDLIKIEKVEKDVQNKKYDLYLNKKWTKKNLKK